MTGLYGNRKSPDDDPIVDEQPFYVRSDSSKIYDSSYFENETNYEERRKIIEEKKKKFPWSPYLWYCIFIALFAFCFGVFYIGGLWNPAKKLLGIKYIVVNNDRGCYSNLCVNAGMNKTVNVGNYYKKLDGTGGRFIVVQGTRNDAIEYVKKFDYWVALYIPEKFTMNIVNNLNVINKHSYTRVDVEVILDETRSYTTVALIRKALRRLQKNFSIRLARSFEFRGGFNPLFLINSITYTETSLHKVEKYGQSFSTFISLMLIWISSISATIITHFYFPFESHWLEKPVVNHPYIKIISCKILTCCLMTLFMTFVIIIIQCICGGLVVEKGYVSFFFFIFYFSLCGLSFNNVFIHIFPFIGFYLCAVLFMMIQITTCGGILDNDVQYGFWKIGRILPMYYGVRQLKNIFWKVGEHTVWVNVLVIFGWTFVITILALFLYVSELRVRRERYLRHESRKNFNYYDDDGLEGEEFYSNSNIDSDNGDMNDRTMVALPNKNISMESMEDFDFTEEEYKRSTGTLV